ncbi:hypothetical protein D3C83_72670 [compost metagenome]
MPILPFAVLVMRTLITTPAMRYFDPPPCTKPPGDIDATSEIRKLTKRRTSSR